MPENKAEEITKALRCSGSPGGPESCDGCPYLFREQLPKELWGEHGGKYVDGCDTDRIVLEAADLLESLLAENERLNHEVAKLKAECDRWRETATKLWAGVPRYCGDLPRFEMHTDEPPVYVGSTIDCDFPDDVVCGMYLPCPGTSGSELKKGDCDGT